MKTKILQRGIGLLATAMLGACLENDEVIEVHADGSVKVTFTAQGDVADLADGYPIPLGGPWTARGDDTQRWLGTVGQDTGSLHVQQSIAAAPWLDENGKPRKARLEVEAEFVNAAAIPEWTAPATEPYRMAYSSRGASLRIEPRGGRRVFVFERTFRHRDWRNVSASDWIDRNLQKEIRESLEKEQKLSDAQWDQVFTLVQGALEHSSRTLAERTLLDHYLQGDASLPVQEWRKVVDSVVGAAMAPVTRERFDAIRRASEKRDPVEPSVSKSGPDPFAVLEQDIREGMRKKLADELAAVGMKEKQRNAALERFERQLTEIGHTDDLSDESFKIEVRMPGVIVGGNYDSASISAATFTFQGQDLRDRDVTLRVVSVVEG